MNKITPVAESAYAKLPQNFSPTSVGTTTLGKSVKNNEKFLDIIKLVSRFLSLQDVCEIKKCAQIPAWRMFGESSPGLKPFQLRVAQLDKGIQEMAWHNFALRFEKQVPSFESLPYYSTEWLKPYRPHMVQLPDGRIVTEKDQQLLLYSEDGSFIKKLKKMDTPISRIKFLADGRISVEDTTVHNIQSLEGDKPTIIPRYDSSTNKTAFQNALLPPTGGFVASRRRGQMEEIVWLKPCGTFGSVCLELTGEIDSLRIQPLLDGGFVVQTREPNKLYVCQPSAKDHPWKVQDVSNVLDLDQSEWESSTTWNLLCKPLSDGRLVISTSTGRRHFWNPKTGECSKNFGTCLPENAKDSNGKFSSLSDGRIVEKCGNQPKWLWSSSGDLLGFFTDIESPPPFHFYFKTPRILCDQRILLTSSTGKRFIFQPNFPDKNILRRTP